jgi:dTDP-4-dehydrorhamnose 3,5-epimerase
VIFAGTALDGAFVIELEQQTDDRGFFARSFCEREFAQHGPAFRALQQSISYNHHKGTLRGLHYQRPPHPEAKIVRCTRGAIFDVIVDLRAGSPTRGRWLGVELTAQNRRSLYIPAGFAHGFQTLYDESEVLYLMDAFYEASASAGVRYDDARLGIAWPLPPSRISDRDRALPGFEP